MRRLLAAMLVIAGCAHAGGQPLLPPVPEWRAADEYLEAHRRELRLRPGDLQRTYSSPTSKGFIACYGQVHRGVRVADVGICLTFGGENVTVADTRARGLHLAMQPRIDAEEVKRLVTRITGFSIQREPELYVLLPGKFGVPTARLAWRVQRWMGGVANALWIDATNGQVLHDEQPGVL